MSGPAFFQTRTGQRFYESTMPAVVDQLARLNTNLEALVAVLQKLDERLGAPPRDTSRVERG